MTFIELFSALVFVCPTDLTAQAQTDKGFLGLGVLREKHPQLHIFTNLEGIQGASLPLPAL